MAKSNWATVAWDEKNQDSIGIFKLDDSLSVEAYKNWIYIYDKEGWTDGGSYVEPCVAQIWEGEINYKKVKIAAKRIDLQNAMLFYCRTGWPNSEKDPYRHMLGICCYGFDDDDWVGVTYPLIEELESWIEYLKQESNIVWVPNDVIVPNESKSFNQGSMYLVKEITGASEEEILPYIQDEEKPLLSKALDKLKTES